MLYRVYERPSDPPKVDLRRMGGEVLPRFEPALPDVPGTVMADLAALNLSPPFIPPAQSRATRFINLRGRGSQRGALVARFENRDRVVVFESLLELHCLHVLMSDPGVVDIWDQPPAISFRNSLGKWTSHTLDYLATYADGRKIGYAVKPSRLVYDQLGGPSPFALDMARVRTAAGHEIRIVTEKAFSRVQVQDARTMHRWCRHIDAEADEIVRQIIPTLQGAFPVGAIRDVSGLAGRAFGAVVRAFRLGLLVKAEDRRLDIDTLVKRNGS